MSIEVFNDLNKIDAILQFIDTLKWHNCGSVRDDLEKTVRHKDDFVLVAKDDSRICGVFAFFVEHQSGYLELTHAFSADPSAYEVLFAYLSNRYDNYKLDVVIKCENQLLKNALKRIGGVFDPVQIKMELTEFKEYKHDLQIVDYDTKYRQGYLSVHSTDVYWTGERVLNSPDIFKVFLAIHNQSVVGYIDTTYNAAENEPYDLFVKEQFRNKGYGKALVSKAVKAISSHRIFVFVEADNASAIRVYRAIGFDVTDEQIQTVSVRL